MKRISRMLGVTLLEIMLVLAVAAMIIVMSIRYYQSAISSQQANIVLQALQAAAGAEDAVSQASGSYISGSAAALGLPSNAFIQPWGNGSFSITGSKSSWVASFSGMPAAVCNRVSTSLKVNSRYSTPAGCASVTYSLVYS